MTKVKGFRLDENLVSNLEKEAEQLGTNLNNYVKNILDRHYNTYRHLERLHYHWFSAKFIKTALDDLGKKDLDKLQKLLEEDLRMQERYLFANLSSKNIMALILNNCKLQDMPYNEIKLSDGSTKYNIMHGLGENWSRIYVGAITELIQKTNIVVDNIVYNDQTLSFQVHHK